MKTKYRVKQISENEFLVQRFSVLTWFSFDFDGFYENEKFAVKYPTLEDALSAISHFIEKEKYPIYHIPKNETK